MQIIIKKNVILATILALVSTYALGGMLKTSQNLHILSNSILGMVVFAALIYFFKQVLNMIISRRLIIVTCVLGSLFSFWMISGMNVLLYNTTNLNHFMTWFKIICGIPLMMAVSIMVLSKCIRNVNRLVLNNIFEQKIGHFFAFQKSFLIIWILIFIAWLPGLVASFPGIYAYDSVYQVGYYLSGKIYLHHPLIDTYLISFCVVNLGKLFGNRELGMLVYSIFQMLILSASFAAVIRFMTQRKVSVLVRSVFLLIFMFLPINPIMSFSATKDIIYSATLIFVLIMMLNVVKEPELLKHDKYIGMFIAIVFINMIFRSQGVYVFIFSAIFGLFYLRKYWKRMLIIIIVPLMLYVVYSGPVTAVLNGEKADSIHEMMSVPCVQLSRAVYYDQNELTTSEKKQVKQYIPNYATIKETPAISDSMKNTFNTPLFRKSPLNFVKLWLKVGLKKPLTYVDAFARITIGLWYPDMNYRDPLAWHPYWEYTSTQQNPKGSFYIVGRKTPKSMEWLAHIYYNLTYDNNYQRIPVISLLFSSGFYAWSMLYYIAWCIYRKRYQYLYPAAVVLGLWLTLILGPVVLYRYVFPIAVALPLLFAEAITANNEDLSQNSRSNQ